MEITHLMIHAITFLVILVPLYQIYSIIRREKGELTKSFWWMFLALVPAALFHLLEFLEIFEIMLLPMEGTLAHSVIDHGVLILIFLSFAWFLNFFRRKYMDQIYG
jgi:hypothetical protein